MVAQTTISDAITFVNHREGHYAPHPAAQLRGASAGKRRRPRLFAGADGSQRYFLYSDVYPHGQSEAEIRLRKVPSQSVKGQPFPRLQIGKHEKDSKIVETGIENFALCMV